MPKSVYESQWYVCKVVQLSGWMIPVHYPIVPIDTSTSIPRAKELILVPRACDISVCEWKDILDTRCVHKLVRTHCKYVDSRRIHVRVLGLGWQLHLVLHYTNIRTHVLGVIKYCQVHQGPLFTDGSNARPLTGAHTSHRSPKPPPLTRTSSQPLAIRVVSANMMI